MFRELQKLCRRLASLALPVPVRHVGHATRDETAAGGAASGVRLMGGRMIT